MTTTAVAAPAGTVLEVSSTNDLGNRTHQFVPIMLFEKHETGWWPMVSMEVDENVVALKEVGDFLYRLKELGHTDIVAFEVTTMDEVGRR